MNFAQFLQVLGRSKPLPLYVVVGPEELLRHQAIEKLLGLYIPSEFRTFNYSAFSDTAEEVAAAVAVAQTWPLGNTYRFVLLRGLALNTKWVGEMLSAYLSRASSRTLMVLEVEDFKKDSALPELAKKHGLQVDCLPLKSHDLSNWIQEYARGKGYQIQADVAKYLASRVGNSLQELAVNLEKLFDWVGQPGRITRIHVEESAGETRELPLWELSDAIIRGDGAKALSTLDSSLRSGEAPLVLLAVISKVFKQVVLARELQRAGKSADEIGKALRIPEFKIGEFMRLVARVPDQWARDMYGCSAELDDKIKSSPTPPRLLLEALVCRATHGREAS